MEILMGKMSKKHKAAINYDKDCDVLYITFGTEEPSYCEHMNIDVMFLIEKGIYSNIPNGVRLVGIKKWLENKGR